MRLAFVAGLNDKKLAQKLAPLQAMSEVQEIHLYRRQPFAGNKIRWIRMPPGLRGFAPLGDLWRFLALLLKSRSYDAIIGCHQRYHGVYASLAGVLRGRPVIQLIITDPVWMEKSFMGGWSLRHAQAIGFRGEKSLSSFIYRHSNGRVLFVTQNVWKLIPQEDDSSEKTTDVIYVGNLMGYKNIPTLLRTIAHIKQQTGRLRALFVGDRPGKGLRRLVQRLGLKDVVTFTGPRYGRDLDICYSQSRVLLLTSFWEGLPMVMAEAMASGIPVVATDVGDVGELLKNGKNGYLVQVGDVEAAAAGVVRLLNDETLYEEMSANARKTARKLAAESTLEKAKATWRGVFAELGLSA